MQSQPLTIYRGRKKNTSLRRRNNNSKGRFALNSKQPIYLGIGFPPKLQMTHTYVDEFSLNSALGVMANYRFRAGGMFDPNHTATGHQPAYYDTLTAIYDHWTVLESVLELTIVSTTPVPAAFGIAMNDDTSTLATSYAAYLETSGVKVNYFSSSAGATVRKIRMKYVAAETWPGDILANRGLQGSATADSGEETFYNVFCQAVDLTSTVAVLCIAKITYTAEWYELADLITS